MAIADAEGFNAPEGNMRATDVARLCRSAGVLRPWHAGRETSKNVGSPRRSWTWKTLEDGLQLLRHRRGKPGHGTMLEPTLHGGTWDRQAEKYCHRERPPDTDG